MDRFLIDLRRHPQHAKSVMDGLTNWWIELGEAAIDAGLDAIWIGDDYGDTHGPQISPTHFREFVLPFLRREVNAFRKKGVPVLLHSDGKITDLIDDLSQPAYRL